DRRRNAAKVAERARKRLAEASATDKETYAGPAVIEVRPVPGMQSDGVALEAYQHHSREHTAEHAASTANTAGRRPSKGDAAPLRSNTLTEEAFESSPGEYRTGDDAGGGRRFSRQFSIPRMYMTTRGVVEAGH
ncbi:hypothetical protein FOZ63_024271, partial [Perkinsus olseni]